MQSAEQNKRLDFSGRMYGAVADWIWIAQTHPSPENLVRLRREHLPPDEGLAETFDVLIHSSDTYISIYRPYFKNGQLRLDVESGIAMGTFTDDHFFSTLYWSLVNSERRRKYPNPADEPPPRPC
ncbi:hypothetical protein GCM10007937_41790 [Mesorhizobium albiziae]|nr:hypothetical protein GCM10007937_41790 [Mesorhizobium albiziae]